MVVPVVVVVAEYVSYTRRAVLVAPVIPVALAVRALGVFGARLLPSLSSSMSAVISLQACLHRWVHSRVVFPMLFQLEACTRCYLTKPSRSPKL